MLERNVGDIERILRGAGALTMVLAAFFAPVPLAVSAGALAGGGYLLFTALAGTCLGYRLMGRSTCPVQAR